MVCVIRSSASVERLRSCTVGDDKCRIRDFNRDGDFFGTYATRVPRLMVLSIVLPSFSKLSILRGVHESTIAGGIPIVLIATGKDRVSGIGNLSVNTSSCVAGPFSILRLVSEIHTVLHEYSISSERSMVGLNRVIFSSSGRVMADYNRRYGLAFGRCRLLGCLLGGGKVTLAHRGVVLGI